MKIVAIIARILLGLTFFVFGLNPFLKFLPVPPLEGVWGQFLGALFISHYVWFVGGVQVISGGLLLIGKYISPGDCAERSSDRQHNCLPPNDAAQRCTAGGSGHHMLGNSVLVLPGFVCPAVRCERPSFG